MSLTCPVIIVQKNLSHIKFGVFSTCIGCAVRRPQLGFLIEKFDITCIAFGKRKKVLEDFHDFFLEKRGILRGSTVEEIPEECPCFVDSRDRGPR